MTKKGQFYIIALVFSAVTLLSLFGFISLIEFSPSSIQNPTVSIANVRNSLEQRNIWIQDYWADLRWHTRTIVMIKDVPANPINLEATEIRGSCTNVKIFNESGEVPVFSVSSANGPCNLTFDAEPGLYEIYWNSTVPKVAEVIRIGTVSENYPSITSRNIEQRPSDGICTHLSKLYSGRNVQFGCNATPEINSYNFSVDYISPDFRISWSG